MGKRKMVKPEPQPVKREYRDEVYTALSAFHQVKYAHRQVTNGHAEIVRGLQRLTDDLRDRSPRMYDSEAKPVEFANHVAHEVLWGVPNLGIHNFQRAAAEFEIAKRDLQDAMAKLTDEERALVEAKMAPKVEEAQE
jgi:hypothetical protein